MNKENRTKRFKSMSSSESQELILINTKAKGIEVGSVVSDKNIIKKKFMS